jgi:hypothetical protein
VTVYLDDSISFHRTDVPAVPGDYLSELAHRPGLSWRDATADLGLGVYRPGRIVLTGDPSAAGAKGPAAKETFAKARTSARGPVFFVVDCDRDHDGIVFHDEALRCGCDTDRDGVVSQQERSICYAVK